MSVQGVRWIGPILDWSGYAEMARGFVDTLDRMDVPVALVAARADRGPSFESICPEPGDLRRWLRMLWRQDDLPIVCCAQPVGHDGFPIAEASADEWYERSSQPHACFTMFETDRLPEGWAASLNQMDAVWVPSTFNRDTFAASGVDESLLRVVQPGVALPATTIRSSDTGGFTFLSVFDWQVRKGWDLLVDTFVGEFGDTPSVHLILKTSADRRARPQLDARLAELGTTADHCGIELIEDMLSRAELDALHTRADAFVLPSRGEGWGLPQLEALARGLPVIATRWSAPLDYLHDDNAFLVDLDGLVSAGDERFPRFDRHLWAEPSADHLREQMRTVVNDREAAERRARRGRADVEQQWTHEAAARRAIAALEDLSSGGRRRAAPPSVVGEADFGWHGLVYGSNSFSVEGRDLLIALDEADVAVALRTEAGPGPPIDFEPSVAGALERMRRYRLVAGAVGVQHATPAALEPVAGRINVARTMLETERVPDHLVERCNQMDENWVPSTWCAEVFGASGVDGARLFVLPESVPAAYFDEVEPTPLPDRRGHAFLAVFDWQLRKGWDVLVRAYARAFGRRDDVVLYLLCGSILRYSPGEMRAAADQAMRSVRAAGLPQVVFLDGPLRDHEMPALFGAADTYVLPTRGEGWGRPFAAAMACGTLAIATGRGGQTEFMTDDNSLLIDSRVVSVSGAAATEREVYAGLSWSEPDEDHLVELLRSAVADDHRDRLARARADIAWFRPANVAGLVVERVSTLLGRPLGTRG